MKEGQKSNRKIKTQIIIRDKNKRSISDTVPKSSDFDKHHICIFYGFTPMLF